MKRSLYEYAIAASKINRRKFVKGAAGLGAVAAMSGSLASISKSAFADGHSSELRKAILQVPGVGVGSPTDADWQKVGEMTLGATKQNVKEGEFKGVKLNFMGLNNQNLHNMLFRGF